MSFTPKPLLRPWPSTLQGWLILSLSIPTFSSVPHYRYHGDNFGSTKRQRQDFPRQRQLDKESWQGVSSLDPSYFRDVPPPSQDGRRASNGHPLSRGMNKFDYIDAEIGPHDGNRRAATLTDDEMSWSAKLRHDLLRHYDRGAYPWEHVWRQSGWVPPSPADNSSDTTVNNTGTLRTGVPVEVGINYHRVFAVDVANAVADLVVWMRMSWEDPRLTWNPYDYGGLERVWFWVGDGTGPGGETSEIWGPDLELWNLETSLTQSLADAHAVVDFDGGVWWSRPGHLRPVCNFEGLNKFPFDVLTCTAEIGSWAYSGLYLRPMLMGEGYSIGGSDTAGEAYAEYKLEEVDAKVNIYPPFPAAPEEDWPVLLHTITFRRAWQPYIRGYLLLQVILNLAAMACFWLPPHCGERMSLCITALLAAVASDLVVSSRLPSASEMTWVSTFSIVSLLFGALALFESAMVIYFYYLTVDTLTPNWVVWINEKIRSIKEERKKKREEKDHVNIACKRNIEGNTDGVTETLNDNGSSDSSPSVKNDGERILKSSIKTDPSSPRITSEILCSGVKFSNGDVKVKQEDLPEEKKKSVLFSDEEKGGSLSQDSDDSFLDESPDKVVDPPNVQRRRPLSTRPGLTRGTSMVSRRTIMPRGKQRMTMLSDSESEFKSQLTGSTRTGIKTILGRDADDFKNAREMQNNLRWQRIADILDETSRVVFPLAYAIALGVLLGPVELKAWS